MIEHLIKDNKRLKNVHNLLLEENKKFKKKNKFDDKSNYYDRK